MKQTINDKQFNYITDNDKNVFNYFTGYAPCFGVYPNMAQMIDFLNEDLFEIRKLAGQHMEVITTNLDSFASNELVDALWAACCMKIEKNRKKVNNLSLLVWPSKN